MSILHVRFKEPRSQGYDIIIEPDILAKTGKALAKRFAGYRIFLISSPTVFAIYGRALEQGLRKAGLYQGDKYLIPDGEQNKSFSRFASVLAALANFGQGRPSKVLVVLLGGGVIGDLGGFVAACYKRGVDFVQIPTTLLSMVDSSVGGKLGVDFDTPQGVIKNLVGAFYQPALVLIDPQLLRSLPAREVRSGFAEVVKTAVLFDRSLFELLEKNIRGLLALQESLMAKVIQRCVGHKARLVGEDEFDRKGKRILLNLGHTFGHAFESASHFKLRHGEAVAVGLTCACDMAKNIKLAKGLAAKELERVERLLGRLGLATRLSGLALDQVMRAMGHDKKFEGRMRFVLPQSLGKCRVVNVDSEEMVREVVEGRIV